MEALTAVQVGLLTIYDMCKAVDRGMLEKHGGKSGDWTGRCKPLIRNKEGTSYGFHHLGK
jgi:hypothetical protein